METQPELGSNTDTGIGSQARDTAGDTGTTQGQRPERERDQRESRERPEGLRERETRGQRESREKSTSEGKGE